MKKILLGAAALATVAVPLAFAGSANAATTAPARCQIVTTTPTTTTTQVVDITTSKGHFTMTEPEGAIDQRVNVYTHTFDVTEQVADGTFTGTGHLTGSDSIGSREIDETVTGQLFPGPDVTSTADDLISLHVVRADGYTYTLDHAKFNEVYNATTTPEVSWPIQTMVSDIDFTPTTTDVTTTTAYANHGAYVEAMGGGKLAAQACAGMPLNSNKPSVR